MKQYTCIVNPIAGKGKGKKYLSKCIRLCEKQNLPYEVFLTQYPGHATEIAQKYRSSDDVVVCFGGDGTFNEILQGQMNSSASISIFPCGSGNDNASSLGIYQNNAMQVLFHGISKTIPLAQVNNKVFLGVASCGFDTQVNALANRFPSCLRGTRGIYLLAVLIACFSYHAPDMKIKLDHDTINGTFLLMAVGHGDRYGGGMLITPEAVRHDQYLDVCLIQDLNRFLLLFQLPKLMRGSHLALPQVYYRKVKEVEVKGDLTIFADGEFRTKAPAKYSITSSFVRLMHPAS